jgi:molecular chaperone DnaK
MYLGIDLGTSNSAIVGNNDGQLRLFKTSDGRDVLPSALFVDRRGHRFVGSKAYDQGLLAPQNVALGFKRLMGTKTPIHLEASDTDLTAEDASAEILRTLMGQANAETGNFELQGAVITVPAAFNQMQSEATIRAARAAGLERVGLLQEPIAAALASLERAANKDGLFLVYDLGGGTFDVALVQSIKGAVTILAHQGINMLGGRDFDKSILNAVIRPWLMDRFDLPDDFQKDKAFQRLMRLAQLKGEHAKIELSTHDKVTIFVSEDEARTADRAGEEIYIEAELTRSMLDDLIRERVDDTIELCRKVLRDNGYTHDDIDRVVLIGGPSKMPTVRDRVPSELGIAADLMTDPMTAVARGAAIFAESRNWEGQSSQRKSNMGSKQTTGSIKVRYEFEARTAGDEARIRAKVVEGDAAGYRISAVSADGRETGQLDLAGSPVLKVSLGQAGKNLIRVTVTDPSGARVADASADLEINRVVATSAGTPATHGVAVKVVDSSSSISRNSLSKLISKGETLPKSGSSKFRAAKTLKPEEPDHILIELFQVAEGVPEPELSLCIGSNRIDSSILSEGDVLRRGDEIVLHWEMDENGLIRVTAEMPSLGIHNRQESIYFPEIGERDFSGPNGAQLAGDAIVQAEEDIEALETDLGNKAATEIKALRRQHERLIDNSIKSREAEDLRAISEEARHIRQEVSRIRHSPAYRQAALSAELQRVTKSFAELASGADATAQSRVEQLTSTARRGIADQDYSTAERAIEEIQAVTFDHLRREPGFVLGHFQHVAKQRHLAADPALHDQLVEKGIEAADDDDIDAVNGVIFAIYQNRLVPEMPSHDLAALAGLMTH